MLLLWPVSPQDVRGQNIAIKVYFRKSLGEHTAVSHRAAPRLIMVPKHHFRQSYSANVFKGLASQATELGLNCSDPVTGPCCKGSKDACSAWSRGKPTDGCTSSCPCSWPLCAASVMPRPAR